MLWPDIKDGLTLCMAHWSCDTSRLPQTLFAYYYYYYYYYYFWSASSVATKPSPEGECSSLSQTSGKCSNRFTRFRLHRCASFALPSRRRLRPAPRVRVRSMVSFFVLLFDRWRTKGRCRRTFFVRRACTTRAHLVNKQVYIYIYIYTLH